MTPLPSPALPPRQLSLSLSLSCSFSLVFSSSNAYRAIGGEDSLPVSPPRSPRFSRAPSRGTDWTIHHRGFSLVLAGLSALSPSLLSVLFSLYRQGVGRTRTRAYFQVCVARGCVRV